MQTDTVTQQDGQTIKSTIEWPAELWKSIRKLGIDRGTPGQQIVIAVMDQWLKEQQAAAAEHEASNG